MKHAYIMIAGLSLVALAIAPGIAGAQDRKPSRTLNMPSGNSVTVDPNTNVSPNVNVGTGTQSTETMRQGTSTSPSTSPSTSSPTNDTPSGAASPRTDDRDSVAKDKDQQHTSDDKATGLDRADQAAGQHGQQGRDNAREKQSR